MACAVMYYPDINAIMVNEWGLTKGFDILIASNAYLKQMVHCV